MAEWINLNPLMAKTAIWQFDGKLTWLCFDGDWICFNAFLQLMCLYGSCHTHRELVTMINDFLWTIAC